MSKRILLAYISNVSGHWAAAVAVEKAIKIIQPSALVRGVSLLHYTNPYSERVINHLYSMVIKKMPQVWEYLYDNPKVVKHTAYLKNLIHKISAKKLKDLVDDFRPDVITCTQAFPCGMFADFKKIYCLDTPLIAIVTDFFPHSYWVYQNVDYYTVANEESKNRLVELGIEVEKVKLFGIPIDPKFAKRLDEKEAVAKKLGLDLGVPAILVMGGGQGLGPIKTIVTYLDGLAINFQLIIVAGTNIKLYRELKKIHFHKKTILLGYIDNIDELMEVSTLIVTKPGGLTISEALSKGVIPIITSPIPGQEENNTRFLLKQNAAFRVKSAEEIAPIAESLFFDRKKYTFVQKNIKSIAKPKSALDIAQLILNA